MLLTAGTGELKKTIRGIKQENIDAKGRDRRDLGDEGENPPKTVLKSFSLCVAWFLCAHLITDGLTAVNVAPVSRAKIPRKWESALIKLLLQFAQILSNGLTAN